MAMGTGSVAEINVTPLIDVLLVLLIIFMVIVPVTPRGLNALVPRPPKSKTEAEPATIVVQVNSGKDGSASYTINQEPFAKAALAPELARIFVSRQQKVMFVKGDANLEYAKVAEVIDLGHQAGVEDVGIITPGAAR